MKSLIFLSFLSFSFLSSEEVSIQKSKHPLKGEFLNKNKSHHENNKKKIKPLACKGKNHFHNHKKEEIETKNFN